jgi:hypothetical protein
MQYMLPVMCGMSYVVATAAAAAATAAACQ